MLKYIIIGGFSFVNSISTIMESMLCYGKMTCLDLPSLEFITVGYAVLRGSWKESSLVMRSNIDFISESLPFRPSKS